jgi:hypothetical protein
LKTLLPEGPGSSWEEGMLIERPRRIWADWPCWVSPQSTMIPSLFYPIHCYVIVHSSPNLSLKTDSFLWPWGLHLWKLPCHIKLWLSKFIMLLSCYIFVMGVLVMTVILGNKRQHIFLFLYFFSLPLRLYT